MFVGLIATKFGMTRIFDDSGRSIPATVLKVDSNRVTQIRTKSIDGYSAVQVSSVLQKQSRLTKSQLGIFIKAKVSPSRYLKEFRLNLEDHGLSVGDELSLDSVLDQKYIDISSYSIGKGFQGGIKRHNFNGQDRSHGNSLSHRAIGATGQCQDPGRVFPGKKMPGRMGHEKVSLRAVKVLDGGDGLLFLKGPIPGHRGSLVLLKPSKI